MKVMSKPEMSMVNPSTDKLMSRVDSRYGLVVCASKRARQLVDGEELKEIEMKSTKDVTNALEEIAEGKIAYKISKADLYDGQLNRQENCIRRDGRHCRL